MIPSLDKRQQCSTVSSVIAIKGTIPQTLLIRIDTKTKSRWERCFNVAWSFYIYIYVYLYLYILYWNCMCMWSEQMRIHTGMNVWQWLDSRKQNKTELLKQGCLCSQSPWEQRAQHLAQNKSAWMLRGVWATEIVPFPHFPVLLGGTHPLQPTSKGSVSAPGPLCPHMPSRWTRLELQHALPKTGLLP